MAIIIEFDSKNAITWANRNEEGPWNLRFQSNKLKNILLVLKNVTFTYKNRETNQFADSLAKEGSQMEGTWIMWM